MLLSFFRPPRGRLPPALAVVVRPPRPGGLTATQPGWGARWRIGPVGRVAAARVWGWCCHTRRSGGGALRGSSPHPLFSLLVCCGSPGRVRSVPSPRRRTGR